MNAIHALEFAFACFPHAFDMIRGCPRHRIDEIFCMVDGVMAVRWIHVHMLNVVIGSPLIGMYHCSQSNELLYKGK